MKNQLRARKEAARICSCCSCVTLTCDQASFSFLSGEEHLIQLLNWLIVCCLSRIWTFPWLVNKQKVLTCRTKPWLVTCVAVWLSVKEIPQADGFWWGEQRERVFVSFKCFSWEFWSQNSQIWTNTMQKCLVKFARKPSSSLNPQCLKSSSKRLAQRISINQSSVSSGDLSCDERDTFQDSQRGHWCCWSWGLWQTRLA